MEPNERQVWSDERINELIKAVLSEQPNHTPRGLARRVAYTVRDDMQAQLETVDALRDALDKAATYKGHEAYACPLCHYENGKFIKHCQMHEQMEMQRLAIIGLLTERDNIRSAHAGLVLELQRNSRVPVEAQHE